MSYGHAHLLLGPRCPCGRPVQVLLKGTGWCARCATPKLLEKVSA